MDKLKKYKTQIFNVITIFLIVTFVIFPGLTEANTFLNIMSGIGLLLLLVWGGLALYHYATSKDVVDEKVVEDKPKRKLNPKQSAPKGTDETAPFVKTRKKATKKTK